jgi:hypothetical protein
MVDEEVHEALESLNRKRTWLLRAIDKFPDLCVYRWDNGPRYCSASVNANVDTFDIVSVVDQTPYHDHPLEQNIAVWCYTHFEGEDIYAWPPKFIIGQIDDGERAVFEHWGRQLRDAGIPSSLISRIARQTSARTTKPASHDWINGDPDYDVWTAQDDKGDIVGVVRVHERLNFEAKRAIRERAAALGIHFMMHDGGNTIESAQDLQAFVDDTVDFYAERESDRLSEEQQKREAA